MEPSPPRKALAILVLLLSVTALVVTIYFLRDSGGTGRSVTITDTPAPQPPTPQPPSSRTPAPPPPPPPAVDPKTLANLFGPAAQPAGTAAPVVGDSIQAAIDRGLQALADAQRADGRYGLGSKDAAGSSYTGITALAGMAFLAHGDLPNRGTYAPQLKKIQDAIHASAQPNGLLAGKEPGLMYNHSLAVEFLANLALLTDEAATREKCRERISAAVKLTTSAQSKVGGWRYTPAPTDADCPQTAGQLIGLRAAAEAGAAADKSVYENAARYLLSLQNPDGGFSYTGNNPSGYARSAAALAVLYHAGLRDTDPVNKATAYLRPFFPEKPGEPAKQVGKEFPYYGLFYAAQAMYLAGGDTWKPWYEAMAADLLAKQAPTGLWPDASGDLLATSAALIALQLPQKRLPALTHEPVSPPAK